MEKREGGGRVEGNGGGQGVGRSSVDLDILWWDVVVLCRRCGAWSGCGLSGGRGDLGRDCLFRGMGSGSSLGVGWGPVDCLVVVVGGL